jgi:predicted deacetylase
MKMPATYLIRFDDICPTMNWAIWDEIDKILTTEGIRPIIAVIPDNRWPAFFIEKRNPRFWEYVKKKQEEGWSVALHGYQHVCAARNPGILGIRPYTEFAGLPEEWQNMKISMAIGIFKANGVRPDLFVAPFHSFDYTTLKVLKTHGITVISDGFSLYPYEENGVVWVPMQLRCFRKMPFGVWTVLFHHNLWTRRELLKFKKDIKRYRERITDFNTVTSYYSSRKKNLTDRGFKMIYSIYLRVAYINKAYKNLFSLRKT